MIDLRTSHVLLTGATGFVGQAVLERLLTSFPGVRVTAVIRPQGRMTGRDRLKNLLRKPVFGPWRDEVGKEEVERIVMSQVDVLEADIAEIDELPAGIDVVIHGASTVSFDPPIDEAFSHNLRGAEAIYSALERSGSDAHVVHVSTAYVGGSRKGVALEGRLTHTVDWRTEAKAAEQARDRVELASREPAVLGRLVAQARAKHGKAGPLAVATAAEEARAAWVRSQLVEYGRVRGESLGWPDVYGFTKALSERAAEELWGERHPLSIVRPSIIESAVSHPYPGWIDGYKVADPLIIAYGRGQLSEFPAFADSVLDVIPVDFVVNAIIAAAEHPPEPAHPAYYHVTSGSRNRLSVYQMYENLRTYFRANPMPHPEKGPISPPTWSFPGSRRMGKVLRNKERMLAVGEQALRIAGGSTRARELSTRLASGRHDLESLRGFATLYEAYTQTELIFDDTNLRTLLDSLSPEVRADRGFDMAEVDWDDYFQTIHFPSITTLTRAYADRRSAAAAARAEKTLPKRTDVVAVFDLEGTVVDSNIVEQYLWVRSFGLGLARWPVEVASLAAKLPHYLRAERRDRGEFIREFQRRYRGMPTQNVRRAVASSAGGALLRRLNPAALDRIRAHREAGHRTVLVTGAIDLIVEPLKPYFDEIVAGRMQERDGVLTGHLDLPPLVDEARAAWLQNYAAEHGVNLQQSYGYGDSYADVGWLRLVGHAHAVNPDAQLFREARSRRWKVDDWRRRGVSASNTR